MAESGWRLGDALHNISARARITAKQVTADHEESTRMRYRTAFMEAGEHEHAELARGLVEMFGGTDGMPDGLRELFDRAGGPTAQFDWLLELALLVVGIFGAAGILVAPEIQDLLNKRWEQNLDMPVSVDVLALAELRGFLSHDEALRLARETGFSPDKYNIVFNDTGEPPSIEQLLFLWRRGRIDVGRLQHGIRQSRVRDEWIDAIEALAFAPPSGQEAIAAAVQGHLTIEEAASVVAQNGTDPNAVGWLYETAGRPPGAEMLIRLMHRGLMSPDDVAQGIRESDIKNKYIDAIIQSGVYIPPVRSIVPMLRSGAINDDRARQLFTANGVTPQDADEYIAEAHKSRATASKALTEANILAGYRDRYVSRADAHARIMALGYNTGEADYLLGLADVEAEAKLQTQLINTTRAKYVAHHIDHGQASTALDSVGVPADQRDHLLALWSTERNETTRTLTPAVLVKGVKNQALSFADFLAYMGRLGYSDNDAQLYAAIEGIGPPTGP